MAFTAANLPKHSPLDPAMVAGFRAHLGDAFPSMHTLGQYGHACVSAFPYRGAQDAPSHTSFIAHPVASAHERLSLQAAITASDTMRAFMRTGTALGHHLFKHFGRALSARDTIARAPEQAALMVCLLESHFTLPPTPEGLDTLALLLAYAHQVIIQDRDPTTLTRGPSPSGANGTATPAKWPCPDTRPTCAAPTSPASRTPHASWPSTKAGSTKSANPAPNLPQPWQRLPTPRLRALPPPIRSPYGLHPRRSATPRPPRS